MLQVRDKLREVLSKKDADDIYNDLKKAGIEKLDVVGTLIEIIDQFKVKKTNLIKFKHELIAECTKLRQEKDKLPPGWTPVDERPKNDREPESAQKSGFWGYFGW